MHAQSRVQCGSIFGLLVCGGSFAAVSIALDEVKSRTWMKCGRSGRVRTAAWNWTQWPFLCHLSDCSCNRKPPCSWRLRPNTRTRLDPSRCSCGVLKVCCCSRLVSPGFRLSGSRRSPSRPHTSLARQLRRSPPLPTTPHHNHRHHLLLLLLLLLPPSLNVYFSSPSFSIIAIMFLRWKCCSCPWLLARQPLQLVKTYR